MNDVPVTIAPGLFKDCIDVSHVGARRLPLDAFYRIRRGSEDRQSRCKVCDNRVRARGIPAAEKSRHRVRSEEDDSDEQPEETTVEDDTSGERGFRARMWKAYMHGLTDTGKHTAWHHRVDEVEIVRWANEVAAELRAGQPLDVALALANEDLPGDFGDEDRPVGVEAPAPPRARLALVPDLPVEEMGRPVVGREKRSGWYAGNGHAPKPRPAPAPLSNLALIRSHEERALAALAELGAGSWSGYDVAWKLDDVSLEDVVRSLKLAEKHGRCRHVAAGRATRWVLVVRRGEST